MRSITRLVLRRLVLRRQGFDNRKHGGLQCPWSRYVPGARPGGAVIVVAKWPAAPHFVFVEIAATATPDIADLGVTEAAGVLVASPSAAHENPRLKRRIPLPPHRYGHSRDVRERDIGQESDVHDREPTGAGGKVGGLPAKGRFITLLGAFPVDASPAAAGSIPCSGRPPSARVSPVRAGRPRASGR